MLVVALAIGVGFSWFPLVKSFVLGFFISHPTLYPSLGLAVTREVPGCVTLANPVRRDISVFARKLSYLTSPNTNQTNK